jgi:CheY-like chemotaxis protein
MTRRRCDGLCLMPGMLGIEVIGAAAGGTDAVRQAAAIPDVALVDRHMPNSEVVDATRLILRRQPPVRVVMLAALSDDDPASDALQPGARGPLAKNADAGETRQAMPAVRAGQAQPDPSVPATPHAQTRAAVTRRIIAHATRGWPRLIRTGLGPSGPAPGSAASYPARNQAPTSTGLAPGPEGISDESLSCQLTPEPFTVGELNVHLHDAQGAG